MTAYQGRAHLASENDDPDFGQSSEEGADKPEYTLAPEAEDLAEDPALVVLIGDGATSKDILGRYPVEWVVSLDVPEIPGQYADTPLAIRLRGNLPVILAPDPMMLGELGEFNRAEILVGAATYGVSAYAVLIPEGGVTEQEFSGLPTPTDLETEGWNSY